MTANTNDTRVDRRRLGPPVKPLHHKTRPCDKPAVKMKRKGKKRREESSFHRCRLVDQSDRITSEPTKTLPITRATARARTHKQRSSQSQAAQSRCPRSTPQGRRPRLATPQSSERLPSDRRRSMAAPLSPRDRPKRLPGRRGRRPSIPIGPSKRQWRATHCAVRKPSPGRPSDDSAGEVAFPPQGTSAHPQGRPE